MRIFLTGATGYIGKALVRRLATADHTLIALVRETSDTAEIEDLGVETRVGDLGDRYSLREPMAGADWVVHLAAQVDPSASAERMHRANVEGSEAVASLAYKLGVGRFLSVSSIAYFGGSPADGTRATEETPVRDSFPSAYSATKHAGERAIQAWAERGLAVDTVYPSLVYGPPGKKSGANWLLRGLMKGRFPVLVGADRETSWIHIDDLVDALVTILETGPEAPEGRDYILAGDVAPVAEVARRVAEHVGGKPPRLSLPPAVARLAVAVSTPFLRLVGKNQPISPEMIESLARPWAFDDSKARRELDWSPRTLAEGLPPTLDYIASA